MKIGRKIFVTLFIAVLLACATFALYIAGAFGDFFSKPTDYKITFMNGKTTVKTITYNVETTSVTEPAVPAKEGYTGKWEVYSLKKGGDITVNPVYTPIDYKIIFTGLDGVVATYNYNIEGATDLQSLPDIPAYLDCTGEWSEFDFSEEALTGRTGDITVPALYTSGNATEGLQYEYSEAMNGYSVIGYTGRAHSVEIPELYKNKPVVRIKTNAFNGNYNIISITLPKTLETIDTRSFVDCTKLVYVCINEENVYIDGNDINRGAYGLTNVALLKTVPAAQRNELIKVYNQYYFVEDGTDVYLMGYCGTDTNIKLPISYTNASNGFISSPYMVYPHAFYKNENIKQITIPHNASISAIGEKAFADCVNLRNLELNNCDTFITTDFLHGCGKIENITAYNNTRFEVSNNVLVDKTSQTIVKATIMARSFPTTAPFGANKVEAYAFQNNKNLDQLIISDFYTQIGQNAFLGCDLITSLTVDNTEFLNENNLGYYFGSATYGDNNTYVPTTLEDVTVKKGALTSYSFANCTGLKNVVIEEGVISLGKGVFSGCANLVSLTTHITGGGDSSRLEYFFDEGSPVPIKNLTVTDGTTFINYGALYNCLSLENIDLPYLGTQLNYSCTLSSLFNGSVSVNGGVPETVNKVTIRSGELSIGAFADVASITSVVLPENILAIPNRAFSGCVKLATWPTNIDNVLSVGDEAFKNCEKLRGNLTVLYRYVGEDAFTGTNLNFHDYNNGKYIAAEDNTFTVNKYYALVDIIDTTANSFALNNQTITIANGVGNECDNLFSFKTGTSLRYINDYAFTNAHCIYEVYDVSNLGFIKGDYSSFGAIAKKAYVKHTSAQTNTEIKIINGVVFVDTIEGAVLPKYMGTATTLTIEGPDSNNRSYRIESYVFANNSTLKNLTIKNVESIGDGCFSNATSLENVNIQMVAPANSSQTTKIGSILFDGCGSLKTVKLNGPLKDLPYATLKDLPYATFRNCRVLESVTLSNSIQTIQREAFYNCNALTTVNMPTGLTQIKEDAFVSTALTEVYIKSGVNIMTNSGFAFRNNANLVLLVASSNYVSSNYQNKKILTGVLDESINHTYVFETNGGDEIESITKWYLTPDDFVTPTHPEGKRFMGWYTDENLTTPLLSPYYFYTPYQTVVLYAKWS